MTGRLNLDSRELERLSADYNWQIEDIADRKFGVWVASSQPPGSAFDYLSLQHDELVDESLWFQVRNRLLSRKLSEHAASGAFWDVGAGVGSVSGYLVSRGREVIAVEPDLPGAVSCLHRGATAISGQLEDLRLPPKSVPAIGVFDVIEHLDDPARFLSECAHVLEPGGKLIVTVPALPWLWSSADTEAGHVRRFTRRSLTALLGESGFKPDVCGYWFKTLVLPMFFLRVLPSLLHIGDSRKRHSSQLRMSSKSFAWLVASVEEVLESLPIAGTSVYGVFSLRPTIDS